MVQIDHNTRGTRQGNIKHAPRTRPIVPMRVLNPFKAENHSPNRSWDSIWMGTWAIFFSLSVIFFYDLSFILNLEGEEDDSSTFHLCRLVNFQRD
jgi:hypothetical protein